MNQEVLILIAAFFILLSQFQIQQLFAFYQMIRGFNRRAVRRAILLYTIRARRARRLNRRTAPYFWTWPRPAESWFEINYYNRVIPVTYFRQQLRMNRETFDELLDILRDRIQRQDSRFRNCIPAEKVLAIGLHRLAHGIPYHVLGTSLNVGKSTAIEATQDVVGALYELRNEHIHFPETEEESLKSIATFRDLSRLPNIVGAIDGTHVRIIAPINNAADYYSRYQHYDFIIQAVADGQKIFLDFASGYPGSMHDARVLRNSTLFARAERREVLTEPVSNTAGQPMGPYLLGDSAYPISSWLIKPYPEGTRDPLEIRFNKELSSARVKVENAFGVLKNRWRIMLKRFDSSIEFATK